MSDEPSRPIHCYAYPSGKFVPYNECPPGTDSVCIPLAELERVIGKEKLDAMHEDFMFHLWWAQRPWKGKGLT